uniref:Protein kinase domain-containing protein n=1 Tax=Hyaloperonospora arabidopsidis (strain Emoy2) TaxID=559515 RepID=M4C2C7_HYAAE
MGAAILKSCFLVGYTTEVPHPRQKQLYYHNHNHDHHQHKHKQQQTNRHVRNVQKSSSRTPAQDVGTRHTTRAASSVTSEAATTSESSFVSDSPSHVVSPVPVIHIHPTLSGFRALLPPQYLLEGVAGKGTTSTCYKCVRTTDNRRFACKIIEKKRLATSKRKRLEVAAQLRREVNVLQRVDHPHIAKLVQSFEDEEFLILVMELLEGGELFDAIVQKGRFAEAEAVHVARSLLSAIQHMHERGVVHRDLKPENMLLAVSPRRGQKTVSDVPLNIKIIDFGFAKVLKQGATSSSFLGTGGYLAPEILLRQPYNASVDMWSFGVLTYLLLCGRLPFAATTQIRPNQSIQMLYRLTFPKRYWHGVSPLAIDFVQRVLVLDPSARLTASEALNHPWLRCSMG